MTPVLELLGVDNSKSSGGHVKETIVENLQDTLNLIDTTSRGVDSSVAHRELMTTISSKRLSHKRQFTTISELLYISRKTIQRYIRRRNMLDENIEMNWVNICRLPRKDKISEDLRRLVIEYWTNHSHVSSNRRDTIQMKDEETGMKISHPKHFIDTTQSELFEALKEEFLDVKICQRMFESLYPCFVCINKVRETCCC